MSVCAAPTCSHQSFDGSSYYVDVDVDVTVTILKSLFNLILFVSCWWRDKDVQLRKHFRFRFQSVYKYQPCSLRSQLG